MSIDPSRAPTPELQLAIRLALEAAATIRQHAGRIERKTKRQGEEAVTIADRASQRLIIAGLLAQYPNDGIIGEESDLGDDGATITNRPPAQGERVWVIDPIDGTNNFINGLGNYAVCIGLLDAGRPVLGVVHDVARDETWWAATGQGAWCNDQRVRVLDTPMSDAALIMLSSNLVSADGTLPPFVARWFQACVWKIRVLGSAALEAIAVAGGIAHGAITLNGKLWDIAGPAAIVLEAGGTLSRPDGRDLVPFDLTGYVGGKVPFLAAGPGARAELVAELQR